MSRLIQYEKGCYHINIPALDNKYTLIYRGTDLIQHLEINPVAPQV